MAQRAMVIRVRVGSVFGRSGDRSGAKWVDAAPLSTAGADASAEEIVTAARVSRSAQVAAALAPVASGQAVAPTAFRYGW